MANTINSQWKILIHVLIDSGKYFDVKKVNFSDELSAVELCQEHPTLSPKFKEWLSKLNKPRERTLKLTNDYRKKGNEAFSEVNGQNDLAADYYTNAIFSAPKDSVELALAHANRAACSVTSERFFEEGYFDCKMALRFEYPKEKLRKLFERKQYLAEKTHKREEYKAETYKEMKKMKVQLDNDRNFELAAYQSKVRKNEFERNEPQQLHESVNVNLVEKLIPEKGRGLVTPEAIQVNQLIYREKAFSFVPEYKNDIECIFYSCQCCAKTNCLPFPCYNCARVSYCTPLCLVNHEPIHKYECVGYQKNLWIKVGDGHLAFRTFLVGFKDAVEKMIERKKSTVREVWSTLISNDHKNCAYGEVLRLVSHIDKINLSDVLYFALTAQMLTVYLLEYTDFFTTLPDKCAEILDLDDWKTLTTAILMRHMAQVPLNCSSPFQMHLKPPSLYNANYGYGSYSIHSEDLAMVISSSSFFVAFFPKMNIINHSCDPNIRISLDGPHLSLHATRSIGVNEEILNCYGPHYKLIPKADRQNLTMIEYAFECKCYRCQSDDKTLNKYFAYYCPNGECGTLVELDGVDLRWWTHSGDPQYNKKINHKFFCGKCYAPLPMNPNKMLKFMQAAKGCITSENKRTTYSTDQDVITASLLDIYFSSSNCLGKYHELKTMMAHTILGFNILASKEEFFSKLAYITMEMYVNRLERFGLFSLEFILITPHALNILKMAKKIEQKNTSEEMARDIAKIRKILDVDNMAKSFTILPKSLQMVFRNALVSILETTFEDGDGDDDLEMVNACFSNNLNFSGGINFRNDPDRNSSRNSEK